MALIWFSALVTLATVAGQAFQPAEPPCQEPSDAHLQTLLRKEFFAFADNVDGNSAVNVVREVVWRYETRCPRQSELFHSTGLANRGICPWYYKLVTLNGWYPREHIEADCRCPRCLSPDNDEFACEKIYVLVNFLRRGNCVRNANGVGVYQYINAYRKIAVACVCAVPRLHV